MDEILETIKPDPDSQYRLLPCRCGSDKVAYVQYQFRDGLRWTVRCFDCNAYQVTREPAPRHDVQLVWNNWAKEETCKTTL